ncbi:UDP-N-acetylmuramoyl-L-alanine--D-glutamate ligase [uncultured Ruminococcus sp.]|uniref:UDP-N-acetylmuramoyl-L-alanine--D-glutamate ligase n=1 Tax=uncultured Ruminococcus sp. TaxID=165186 RepID=UPI002638A3D4|nr:UDP-N-acetylmuramoyl-L-alanine--D-glutamate ligase [uncultured Ruminococcus sp.]
MSTFSDHLNNITSGKTVCILGFGREGKATYRRLVQYCSPAEIAIADLNPIDAEANGLPESVRLITGKDYQSCLDDFDIVFKSPGIVLDKHPSQLRCTVTSETQEFFTVYREQIIGITGTKGKSTVTSLIFHILRESGVDAHIAGNIGIPVFEIVDDMKPDSVVVCELSCHQLEYMSVSPAEAVFLNLYEEHLDHYGSLENYYNAKKNIYLHQKNGDELIINHDIRPDNIAPDIKTVSAENTAADIYVSDGVIRTAGAEYSIPTDRIKLLGVHNHYNIAVAYEVCRRYVSEEQFTKALCSFSPLAHRLEFVGIHRNIRWYDDSISTACATAIEATKSVPNAAVILIGGMDRGIDYTSLVEYLCDSDIKVICMEASGKRVYDMLTAANCDNSRIHYVPHLADAVELAAEITPPGKSCVMSPAAASYGIFRNFEERGDAFKALVRALDT